MPAGACNTGSNRGAAAARASRGESFLGFALLSVSPQAWGLGVALWTSRWGLNSRVLSQHNEGCKPHPSVNVVHVAAAVTCRERWRVCVCVCMYVCACMCACDFTDEDTTQRGKDPGEPQRRPRCQSQAPGLVPGLASPGRMTPSAPSLWALQGGRKESRGSWAQPSSSWNPLHLSDLSQRCPSVTGSRPPAPAAAQNLDATVK